MNSLIERRRLLQAALIGGTAVALPPMVLDRIGAQTADDTILLTITLGGGNDWLNTIGPFEDPTYRDARGRLAINPTDAAADDGHYFHPSLSRLATRYRRGEVAVIRGVGEPRIDRSHFSNMQRWMTGLPDGAISSTGWLGRWLNQANAGAYGGIGVGTNGVPLHLRGSATPALDLPRRATSAFGANVTRVSDLALIDEVRRLQQSGTDFGGWVDAVAETTVTSIDSARTLADAFDADPPEGVLRQNLELAARIINLGVGTRVLGVFHNGFDTHSQQVGATASVGRHADLLDELDRGLDSFFLALDPSRAANVVVMVFSEFGRRVRANGSMGTDHGTAGHLLLVGRRVNGGMYGEAVDLTSLDRRGDVAVQLDHRRVYASVIEDWLGSDSGSVLSGSYAALPGLIRDDTTAPAPEPTPPAEEPETDPEPPASGPPSLNDRASEIRGRRRQNRRDYLQKHSPRFST